MACCSDFVAELQGFWSKEHESIWVPLPELQSAHLAVEEQLQPEKSRVGE